MMLRLWAAVAFAIPAVAVAQGDIALQLPLACTLGKDCYINDYFDRDPSGGVQDFMCGTTTRDTHRGVDFAVRDLKAMRDGMDVLAAATGTVTGRRDGMPDIAQGSAGAPNVNGRECGNGVVLDHGGGWLTQYCHLKEGSVTVADGDKVAVGTPLGQVGLSGQTSYPHVHFSLYKDRQRVDPFAPDMTMACGTGAGNGPWADDIIYRSTGLIKIGLTGTPPKYDDIKDHLRNHATIAADAPVMVVWAYGFAFQVGDVVEWSIEGPDGWSFENRQQLEKGNKLGLRFAGKRRRNALWPEGDYFANVRLIRDGRLMDQRSVQSRVISQ